MKMIRARQHPFYLAFFDVYTRIMLKSHFRRIVIQGEVNDRGQPILMIGNHFSWWDGFIARYVNMQRFRRRFYVMMLEEQLSKRMFLSRAGAFSIRRGHRSILETVAYARGLLSDPRNLLLLYPQGEIRSKYTRPLEFEKGWYRILRDSPGPFQVVMYITLVDYFSRRRPSANIYLEELLPEDSGSRDDVQRAFNRFLERCVALQKEDV
ncbi:MAG: lysophospholipid acyltransferase family protein [Bacteroidales bacterium]|nr:lysophospholipid acyltransferase family protein [Bacteroidales bacterium]